MEDQDNEMGFSEEEYEAAFNAQIGGGSQEEHDEPQVEELPETEQAEEAGEESSAEEETVLAGLTESQLKDVLAKAQELDSIKAQFGSETQKIYGKFGELQRELKSLRGGGKLKISRDIFKALDEEYPELADALAKDLSGIELSGGGFDEERFNTSVDERVKKLERAFEAKLLSVRHRDWQQKIESADYKLWLGTLPEDQRSKVKSTTDGLEAANYLDDFDGWRGKTTKKQEATQQKSNRLARAIQPSGATVETRKQVMDDEAAFQAGLKAAFKERGIIRGKT